MKRSLSSLVSDGKQVLLGGTATGDPVYNWNKPGSDQAMDRKTHQHDPRSTTSSHVEADRISTLPALAKGSMNRFMVA